MPRCWAANGITVVVPPNAAEVVALANVSALTRPDAESCSMWQWLSTPPGSTSLPEASTSRRPAGSFWPTATIPSPRTATSAANEPVAVATVPPRTTRSYSGMEGSRLCARPNPTSLARFRHCARGVRACLARTSTLGCSESFDHRLPDRHRAIARGRAHAQGHRDDGDGRWPGLRRAEQLGELRCQRQADLLGPVRLGGKGEGSH